MNRTLAWLTLPMLLAGCPKKGAKAPADPAAAQLQSWARGELDIRTWRSCARSALRVDLAEAEVVIPVDADGIVGTVSVHPENDADDPGMICLQMELAYPPEKIDTSGEARTFRMRAGDLYQRPSMD